MTYKHLTIEQRIQIQNMISLDFKKIDISSHLNLNPTTLYRELNRNSRPYNAYQAQERYEKSKSRCGAKVKLTPKLKQEIEDTLDMMTSPEIYCATHHTVSYKTVYTWITKGYLSIVPEQLVRRMKKPKSTEKRGKITSGRSISERPESVESRNDFGHWELDTVVSPRGKDKTCIATFAERASRIYFTVKIPDRTAESMITACAILCQKFPKQCFKSLTCDNGKEFSKHEEIENIFNCPLYFADPFSSYQRGTNENSNGLLRRFFPKGTCFSEVSDEELLLATNLINSRPRKVLNFKTNDEKFQEYLLHLI